MPSYYSVVRYVPDPVRDERINVGVVVFDEADVYSKFVYDWARVRRFGSENIDFVKDFARRVMASSTEQPAFHLGEELATLTPEAIRDIAGRWMNSIQWSEPRASILAPTELLNLMSDRLLYKTARRRRMFRDRRIAVTLAKTVLTDAIDNERSRSKGLSVDRNMEVHGALATHVLDVGVRNGRPLLGMHGISFEGPARKELLREIDATAWSIDDIHVSLPDLKVGILVLPPKTASRSFADARHIFEGLGAEIVVEQEAYAWARASTAALAG